MHVLLLLLYLGIAILKNDVHIVNISNGNIIYHVLLYHINYYYIIKEGQVTLDRSPEFCLKLLSIDIY